MEVFNKYAQYYDLLYSTKNYEAEVNYVDSLIEKYCPQVNTILDLGCGTGSHDFYLAKKGYTVEGVDVSKTMVKLAQEKKEKEGIENISFQCGDITSLKMGKEFDTVISLFHVMNYLKENSLMQAGFSNATKHLKKGGLFIFDCWYGPAVLSDHPKSGVKRLENEKIKVTRIVEPLLHPNRNVVDVNYEIVIKEKATSKVETISEKHSVRYFFMPEIQALLQQLNMEIISAEEWLTGNSPGVNTFGVCFISRKL